MEYIKDMFMRMDLGHIRQFLLYGEDQTDRFNHSYTHSYMDKLKIGSDPILNRLKNLYPDKFEFDKAVADLSLALTTYESVYTEVGMKAGARLIYQLLLTEEQYSPEWKI